MTPAPVPPMPSVPTFLDHWRVQSDFRRLNGKGTLLDTIFLYLRNWWLK